MMKPRPPRPNPTTTVSDWARRLTHPFSYRRARRLHPAMRARATLAARPPQVWLDAGGTAQRPVNLDDEGIAGPLGP